MGEDEIVGEMWLGVELKVNMFGEGESMKWVCGMVYRLEGIKLRKGEREFGMLIFVEMENVSNECE